MTRQNNPEEEAGGQNIDPAMIALLSNLWRAALSVPAKPWSLAKLSKQSEMQMSTLLRHLNTLAGAGLASITTRDEGGGSADLTATGRELCQALFGMAANDAPL